MAGKTATDRKVDAKVRSMKKQYGSFTKADAVTIVDMFRRYAYNSIKCEELEGRLEEEGDVIEDPGTGRIKRNPTLDAYNMHVGILAKLQTQINRSLKDRPEKDEREALGEFISAGLHDGEEDW